MTLGFISWLGEGIALYFVFLGLGISNGRELLVQGVFILAITSLAGAVFLLPGGLGVAEGGITGLGQALVGLSRDGAAAAALLIRLDNDQLGTAAAKETLEVLAEVGVNFAKGLVKALVDALLEREPSARPASAERALAIRERGADAQELQRLLRAENFGEAGDLAEVIQAMRDLDDPRVYQDVEEIARLQTFVIEGLKRFEYQLRREVDGESEELFLAGGDEVPNGFRDLIEEYFRALAEN